MKYFLTCLFIFIILTNSYSQSDSTGIPKYRELKELSESFKEFIDNLEKIHSFIKYFGENNKRDDQTMLMLIYEQLDRYGYSYFPKTSDLILLYYSADYELKPHIKERIKWDLTSSEYEINESIKKVYSCQQYFLQKDQLFDKTLLNFPDNYYTFSVQYLGIYHLLQK